MAQPSFNVIKFRFGVVVVASDGEAGAVAGVLVQPSQRIATHLVVKIGRGPGGVLRAVPLERVTGADAEAVHLSITREALLSAMNAVSAEQTQLSKATQVTNNQTNLGTLSQVSVIVGDNHLHRLGVRRGLTSGEVLVAATQITSVDANGRAVDCATADVTQVIPYRPDADLLDDVQTALYNYPRLHVDLRAVQVRVVDGEAWLLGNVASSLNRRILEELLVEVRGLTAIHNEVVADNELAVQIAQALARDPRTRGQLFGVYPNLGEVFLRGNARSPEALQAAIEIAQHAGTGHHVTNQMILNSGNSLVPMLAPVTGTSDIIPGGD
ncbi:MAG: BON domain-containing protein [Ktedonobacterales bacterium]|nr:BON domain-containing protein [Ktedonobacterales bacterium]